MSSTPPRVTGSPDQVAFFEWVRNELDDQRNASTRNSTRIQAVNSSASNAGNLATDASVSATQANDRVVGMESTNRIARPITDYTYWQSVVSGATYVFPASTARNVSYITGGGFTFQPIVDREAAEIDITPILPTPESHKLYVEAEFSTVTAQRPEIWVHWRDENGNVYEAESGQPQPTAYPSKSVVTVPKRLDGTYVPKYSVRLVRPSNAGTGGTFAPRVFEGIGSDGLAVSPGGISVEDSAGNTTIEINPSLPVLDAPTAPILTSSVGTVTVRWNGALTSGAAPAHLSYVYAEEATTSAGPWTRVGQPLNRAGDIITRPPVDATRWYRLTAVDTSNRPSPAGAAASIVVAGVDVPDLSGNIGDILDTVDGLNKIFFAAEGNPPPAVDPTTNRALANGDLWYVVLAETGAVTGVNSWNGVDWVPRTFVADSIFVPGSVGTVSIADGAVSAPKVAANSITADKMTVGFLDGYTIRGVYMESPTISSGPNVGTTDLLSDPMLATAPDTTWVASGWLGDAGNIVQTDTISWDQTQTSGGTSWRMRGNAIADMYVKPITRTTGSLTFRSAAGMYSTTGRTITNPYVYTGYPGYPGTAYTDPSLKSVGVTPYTGASAADRTTYLKNSTSATVAVGDLLRIDWAFETPSDRSSSTGDDVSITAQIIRASDSVVLAEFVAPTSSGTAISGSYISTWTSTYAGAVTLRFKSVYKFAGGGMERRIRTGGYVRRDTISGTVHPSYPDFNRSAAGYALDPRMNPDYDVLPANSTNFQLQWRYADTGFYYPSQNFAKLTRARLSRLNPTAGFLITTDGGFQAFDTLGRVTARINGSDNLISGRLRSRESGNGIDITDGYLTAGKEMSAPLPNSTRTELNFAGISIYNRDSGAAGLTVLSRDTLALSPTSTNGASALITVGAGGPLLGFRRAEGANSVLLGAPQLQALVPMTDAARVALPAADLFTGLRVYCTDTDLEWRYVGGAWKLLGGRPIACRVIGGTNGWATTLTAFTWSATDEVDTDGMWNSGQPTRITIPYTGLYRVSYGLLSSGTLAARALVAKNGGTAATDGLTNASVGAAGAGTSPTNSGLGSYVAGDYLEVKHVSPSTGSGLWTPASCYFAVEFAGQP